MPRNFARADADYNFIDLDTDFSRRDCQTVGLGPAIRVLDRQQAMHLDLPTLMAMESFVAACCGGVLLFAWGLNRSEPALGLWGLSDILVSAGIFLLMLGGALHMPIIMLVGGSGLVLAKGLQWQAARRFNGKPAPFVIAMIGAVVVIGASLVPGLREYNTSLGLGLSTAYLIATVVAMLPRGAVSLPARVPIIGIVLLHAAILSIGAYSAFNGTPRDIAPPLMSLFGVIHFESIIFAVGTAVFLLALVAERREAASRVAAGIDSLTGISNRAAFTEAANAIIERCRVEKAPVSVIMFDLDRFKAVNDGYGHAVGDEVIKKFCEAATTALRPGDVFGRLGGEEFAVMMARSSIEPALVRAERIRAAFAENCRIVGNQPVNATVSGGVAASENAAMTLGEMLKFSDEALYRAKAAGRNRIRRAGQVGLEGGSSVIRVA